MVSARGVRSAAAVATVATVTGETAMEATEDGTLVKARRVVLRETLLLNSVEVSDVDEERRRRKSSTVQTRVALGMTAGLPDGVREGRSGNFNARALREELEG